MVKSVALTLAVLALGGFALDRLALHFVTTSHGWLAAAISVAIGLGVVGGAGAARRADDLAGGELFLRRDRRPGRARGRSRGRAGPRRAARANRRCASLRFAALTLIVMLAALVLLFVPGIGFAAWFAANAYLLGREYFELAAMRFRSADEARAMRRYFAAPVFIAGLIVAAFVSVPILNLATPLVRRRADGAAAQAAGAPGARALARLAGEPLAPSADAAG